jgi:hypothetical protein
MIVENATEILEPTGSKANLFKGWHSVFLGWERQKRTAVSGILLGAWKDQNARGNVVNNSGGTCGTARRVGGCSACIENVPYVCSQSQDIGRENSSQNVF